MNLACPTGVRQQLDGLYRWQVQRMNQPDGPTATLSSQRDRFTPELFNLLMEAWQLTPTTDGRYLDFDVFSNTQVRTFEAVVTGCNTAQGNGIEAAVEVSSLIGELGGLSALAHQLLLLSLSTGSPTKYTVYDYGYPKEEIHEGPQRVHTGNLPSIKKTKETITKVVTRQPSQRWLLHPFANCRLF